jgi:hypothetical protein
MTYVSVLTPPFLMCAVVIVAIVAFLRHEIGRGRSGQADHADDNSAAPAEASEEVDSEPGTDAGSSATASSDS